MRAGLILVGGGIVVFLLYRYLAQRQSAAGVSRSVATTQRRVKAAFALDDWAKQFGAAWEDLLNKNPPPPDPPTNYTPTPPLNAPPEGCGAGMRWDPQFGICVSAYS